MSKLREYRKRNRISLEKLGEIVGVKKATLSRIENGTRSPSLGLVRRLCEATGGELTPNDFVLGDEAA